MLKQIRNVCCGLLTAAALCVTSRAEVVFYDGFDTTNYPAGGTVAEFLAMGWTTVNGNPPTDIGTFYKTQYTGVVPESGLWANNASLEFNATNVLRCGDLLQIEASAWRFYSWTYIEEIILWDGSDPGTKVTVTNWSGAGVSPYWPGWYTPAGGGPINSLYYQATAEDAGKRVIFKYGHGATWSETLDVTFSITPTTLPVITRQTPSAAIRTVGESLTLSVAAAGCNLSYQWQKNGGDLTGQTDTMLMLGGLTSGDAGGYSCRITGASGPINSTTCQLTLEPKVGTGASISFGINFENEAPFNPSPTAPAYGVHQSRWQDTPPGRFGGAVNESGLVYMFGAGFLDLSYSAANTYGCWWVLNPAVSWQWGLVGDELGTVKPGDAEVNDGYLDDGGSGYSVTLVGMTTSIGFKEYVVRTIAASDSATAFNNVALLDNTTFVSQDLVYGPLFPANDILYGKAAVSSTSTTMTNDSITLTSAPGSGTTRGCLAGLIITDKPVILAQPEGPADVVFNGESFSLNADAFGVLPLSYQWRKNGTSIPGATTSSYSKTVATTNDSGVYTLVVTNAYGAASSVSAAVTVVEFIQPTIIQQPVACSVYAGGTARFSVLGYGGELSYQWNKGGTPIPDATTTVLTLTGVTALDAVNYSCTVTNPAGTTNSSNALLTVIPIPTSGYLSKVLGDNPLSLWRLDETSGTTLYDSFGGRNGAYVGGVGLGQPGFMDGDASVNFPNSGWVLATPSTYADVPYDPALNPSGPFSVELWVKPNGIPGDLFSPLSSMNLDAGRPGYLFYMNGASGWQFRLGNAGGYIATASGGTSSANWTHLVGVYDGTSAYLYVNGVQYGPVAASGFLPSTTVPLRIGAPTGFSRPWNGLVDEVAFYNYALNSTQVRGHFVAAPLRVAIAPVSDLVVNAKPSVGPVHGLNYGAVWAASDNDGVTTRTGVMQFNATEADQVAVNGYSQLDSTNGTICFWVRVSAFPGTGSESAILMDRRDTGGGGSGTIIAINDGQYATAGTVFFQANPSGANPFSSFGTVNDGKWHHIAVTYGQNVNDYVSIYIDGTYDSQQANSLAWWWPSGMSLLLGKSRDTYWKKLDGGLDDVRFYNRILSEAEIGTVKTGGEPDGAALVLRLNFDTAPVSGYRLTTSPGAATIQSSSNVGSGYTDLSASPYNYVPTGPMQFFRAWTSY